MLPHAGDNWWCSLVAGARLGSLFGGSIFRAGRPGSPLTRICVYKYPLSNVGAGRMFTRSGKGALGSKDRKRGKREERGKEEVRSKRSPGVGGLQRGSEGPTLRIFLCGSSFGLAQVTESSDQERPLARGVETFALRPLVSGGQKPQVQALLPQAPPASLPLRRPRAGSHRVGCGGSVAGPEGRQGDGGGWAGPHSAPGGPRSEPRGSLKLTNCVVPSSA